MAAVTLPETNLFSPENGWLEDDFFLLGWPIFRGYVSFEECIKMLPISKKAHGKNGMHSEAVNVFGNVASHLSHSIHGTIVYLPKKIHKHSF